MTPLGSVLVLGGTGMLGHVLLEVLSARYDTHAAVRDVERAQALGLRGPLHALDAREPAQLERVLDAVRPDAVINAIGLVKQLEEAARPLPAIALNALFPHALAERCAARGVRLVHVSTDCVFSGSLPPPAAYTEDDPADARDLYGMTKLLGEVHADGALTVRTSIVGWELERASGLLEWFAAQDGRTVAGYSNAYFSGLTTRALARVLSDVLADHPSLSGLYHVSSERISKLDLLMRLREALRMHCEITPVQEPRINRALDSRRFREVTAIAIPGWAEMIDEYRRGGPEL
jgi:dTDP-4-dehydrorhamnose reductase